MGHKKLPPGCNVEWVKEPEKQTRLLDWLDDNPAERAFLFMEVTGPTTLTKYSCAAKAAKVIFRNDENPKNSVHVQLDPAPFASAIGVPSWKPKYGKFNEAIGPHAAKTPFSNFQPGSQALKVAAQEMKKFPQWTRLHIYWRASPFFNPFVHGSLPSPAGYGVKAATKRKAPQAQSEEEPVTDVDLQSEDEDEMYVQPPAAPKLRPRQVANLPAESKPLGEAELPAESEPPARKRYRRLSNASHKTVKFVTERQDSEAEEDSGGFEASRSQLTGDQIFQLQMAQLRYKTQREENIARQQEQTERVLLALLDAVKH